MWGYVTVLISGNSGGKKWSTDFPGGFSCILYMFSQCESAGMELNNIYVKVFFCGMLHQMTYEPFTPLRFIILLQGVVKELVFQSLTTWDFTKLEEVVVVPEEEQQINRGTFFYSLRVDPWILVLCKDWNYKSTTVHSVAAKKLEHILQKFNVDVNNWRETLVPLW